MKYYRIIKCNTLENVIEDVRIKDGYTINFTKIFSLLTNIILSILLLISGAAIDRLVRGLDWEYVKNALKGIDKNKIVLIENDAIKKDVGIKIQQTEPIPTVPQQITKLPGDSLNILLPLAIPNTIPSLAPIKEENTENEEIAIDVVIRERNLAPNSTNTNTTEIKKTIIQNKE